MASPSLIHSAASFFYSHLHNFSSPTPVRLPCRSPRNGNGSVVLVRATGGVVLVDKSEAEKTYRLKTTYLEKIVPLLKEEFKYANIHEVMMMTLEAKLQLFDSAYIMSWGLNRL